MSEFTNSKARESQPYRGIDSFGKHVQPCDYTDVALRHAFTQAGRFGLSMAGYKLELYALAEVVRVEQKAW